jgi:hypothetical protein
LNITAERGFIRVPVQPVKVATYTGGKYKNADRAGALAPGWCSIVNFELVEQGLGAEIVFDHVGFPKGLAQQLLDGWNAY